MELLVKSLWIMLTGMGLVVIFLLTTILAIVVAAKVINRYFPTLNETETNTKAHAPSTVSADNNTTQVMEQKKAAALAGVLHHIKQHHGK